MHAVSAIQFNVHDLDAAIAFYCDHLGFETDITAHYPALVTLKHNGLFLILNQVEEARRVDYPRCAQVVVNFRVPDLTALMADLRAKGLKLLHEQPQPCPVGRYAAIADPSGNVIELVEFAA